MNLNMDFLLTEGALAVENALKLPLIGKLERI
jgi:hypothetical protein